MQHTFSTLALAAALAATILLGGCGQMGPLYEPEPGPPAAATPSAQAAAIPAASAAT